MTATIDDIVGLRGRLSALRDDVLDQLCAGIGSGEIELLAATAAAMRACDERLAELRQAGDPGRQ